jgi:RNA polymerase sigma factor (sigma-70 family)
MSQKTKHSDKEILRALRKNTVQGWEMLCAQFDPMIQSIVNRSIWKFSEHDRQDVCQNIYIQVEKALPSFKGTGTLAGFIATISHHQCVDEIRRKMTRQKWTISTTQKTQHDQTNDLEFVCTKTLDPHHEILQKERRSALLSALNLLQATCQDSISMFYIKSLSYNEMSSELGISKNTVGSRLSKCLEKLHKELLKQPLFERTGS